MTGSNEWTMGCSCLSFKGFFWLVLGFGHIHANLQRIQQAVGNLAIDIYQDYHAFDSWFTKSIDGMCPNMMAQAQHIVSDVRWHGASLITEFRLKDRPQV